MTRKDIVRRAVALGAVAYNDSGEVVLKVQGQPTMRMGVGSHASQGVPGYVRSWLRRVEQRKKR